MNDFMYNKALQLIEDKLQLELQIIKLKGEINSLKEKYDLKVNSLELKIAELDYDNFKLKNNK
jgi:hypothetical protein